MKATVNYLSIKLAIQFSQPHRRLSLWVDEAASQLYMCKGCDAFMTVKKKRQGESRGQFLVGIQRGLCPGQIDKLRGSLEIPLQICFLSHEPIRHHLFNKGTHKGDFCLPASMVPLHTECNFCLGCYWTQFPPSFSLML